MMTQLDSEASILKMNAQLSGAGREKQYDWLIGKLYEAFAEARMGKQHTINEQKFEENRDLELIRLAVDILSRKYAPAQSVTFVITSPTPREIFAASFRDRVVHHFLIQHCGDFWDKRLSSRSFSCREKKGEKFLVKRSLIRHDADAVAIAIMRIASL